MSDARARARSELSGRVVLITGAAGGIGTALAHRFADAGARVALGDLDPARLAATADSTVGDGGTAIAIPFDVTDTDACRAAVAHVAAEWGGIDVLVNNAGITHLSLFRDTDPSVIRRVVDVNLFGAVNVTSAALPYLLASRGRIVTVSSVAGVAPLASRTGYSAAKHALHGLFDSLRAELRGSGVSVTIICPQFVNTAIGDRALGGDGGPPTMPRTTTGRAVEPDDVAAAIVDATVRRRRILLYPRDAKVSYLVARFAPALYERMMAKRILAGVDATLPRQPVSGP